MGLCALMVPPPISKQLNQQQFQDLKERLQSGATARCRQSSWKRRSFILIDGSDIEIVCSFSSHHCVYNFAQWALPKIYSANITIHASMQITTMAMTKKIKSRFE